MAIVNMQALAFVLFSIGVLAFSSKRLMRYLRFYQQEEYEATRFAYWYWRKRCWDQKATGILLLGTLFSWLIPGCFSTVLLVIGAVLGHWAYHEEDPTKEGKITLKMTPRAARIYLGAFLLYYASFFFVMVCFGRTESSIFLASIGVVQIVPFLLPCANAILSIEEQHRQEQYKKEAKQIVRSTQPFIIGITGSYGKTSTKNALCHLLQHCVGPIYWPRHGVNTPMGICRDIRENLHSGYRYAVIEMGAYGPGSIKRLCELTPPNAAILTTIGVAHLERFGSQETILHTKAELVRALPVEGIVVANGDDAGVRKLLQLYPKKNQLLYGSELSLGSLATEIVDQQTTEHGTSFSLRWQDKEYHGTTPLFGKTALSNVVGAFTMACALGADPHYVLACMHHLTPVKNRLQLQRVNGATYLHDAYNSNPSGFVSALEVLKALSGGRKILLTPGVIELGSIQNEENEKLGRLAASHCDLAFVIGLTNGEAITRGLRSGGMDEKAVLRFTTRDEAMKHLKSILRTQDVVLIANDLGDLYEAKPKF